MKTKTTQYLIATIVIALALVGVYMYAVEQINGMTVQTKALKNEIAVKEVVSKDVEKLQRAVQVATEQKSKITSYIVAADGAVNFVGSIEKIADNFGLSYDTQNITEEKSGDLEPIKKELLRIDFSAEGSWDKVMRFVKAIETLPYGMQIDKIDLDSRVNSSADGTSTASTRVWGAHIIFSVVKVKDNAN
jgi:Tfp pilus assembly protein PilO